MDHGLWTLMRPTYIKMLNLSDLSTGYGPWTMDRLKKHRYGKSLPPHLIPNRRRFLKQFLSFQKLPTMRSENILSADILDLIFENRNKSYGAYLLRKGYNGRLVRALLLVFVLAAGLLLVTKVFRTEKKAAPFIYEVTKVQVLPDVKLEAPKKPARPAAPPPPAQKAVTQQWVSNMEIVQTNPTKLSENLDSAAIASTTQDGPAKGSQPGKEPGPVETTGAGNEPTPVETVDRETPRATADLMPAYPGGMEALRKFLQRNLENPEDLEPGTVITVKIRFVVGYDGKLKAFQTVEDGGPIFNNEVLRVLKKMPAWIPGRSNGEKVSVYYTIPVKFTAAE
jgi:protein TonB